RYLDDSVLERDSVRQSSVCRGKSRDTVFFQAEDGIRDSSVTGVQTCALPISQVHPHTHTNTHTYIHTHTHTQDRKSVVEGKSVDLGGRRLLKKKQTSRDN